MRWLILVAMAAAGLFLGPLLIMLWAVVIFSAVGAASLLSFASTLLHRVRGA